MSSQPFGRWYFHAVLAVIPLLVAFPVIPAYTALLFPFFEATGDEYLEIVLAFEVALGVAGAGAVSHGLRRHRPIIAWLAGDRTPAAAAAARRSAVVDLPRSALVVGAWYVAGCVPAAVYTAHLHDLDALGITLYVVLLAYAVAGLVVIGFLYFERAVAPIVREAAAIVPRDGPRSRGMRLGTRLLVILPAANLWTGLIVAMASANQTDVGDRLVATIGSVTAMTATLALGYTYLLRGAVVRRLATLQEAMARVDGGDLDVRMPQLAGDELDDVGDSFNVMVEGLRERDALRRHSEAQATELRASRTRIVAAADATRRGVERDLHDGAQQRLVLVRRRLAALRRVVADDPSTLGALRELEEELAGALAELRDLAHGIYPALLESDGLPAALDQAVARSGLAGRVVADGVGRHEPELEAAVYFCCREALQNAAKYAGDAATVEVRLAEAGGCREWSVADDGVGFAVEAGAPEGAGLTNMRDRMGALGGELRVRSAPGEGTTVLGRVPVRGAAVALRGSASAP